MQSEVLSLPVVCSDKHSCSSSKYSDSTNGTPRKSKSSYNSSTHLSKRKAFHDPYCANNPYRNSARFYTISQPSRSSKNLVSQRVMSAKMLRVKHLQNQLTDAHYHLNELSNENKLLKTIQKKQEAALKKYEGANAELPRLINSHHEELRALQIKYKKLKEQHKNTCDNLKEKEKELHSLQILNKKLLQLSQDRNLQERDKLQSQVSDLNYQIQQQQEVIQTLNKKLQLETKSLKQQIHAEVMKHKETQKNLHDTLEKLKSLEDLLDNRERRLYYNNQLPIFNKNRIGGNQSFSSLEDSGMSLNYSKSSIKKVEIDASDKILPNLSDLDMNFERKVISKNMYDTHHSSDKKILSRLSKSGSRSISTKSSDLSNKSPNSRYLKKQIEDESLALNLKDLEKLDLNNKEDEDESFSVKNNQIDELDYPEMQQFIDEMKDFEKINLEHENLFKKSREICARLTAEESPKASGRTIVLHKDLENIEQIIEKEFKQGKELAMNIFHQESFNSQKIEENISFESESKSQVIVMPLQKLNIEDINQSQDTQKKEEKEEVNNDDDVEEYKIQDIKIVASQNENGDKTFRHSISYNDLENYFDRPNFKAESSVESEIDIIERKKSEEIVKEKLDVYLDNENKLNSNESSAKILPKSKDSEKNLEKNDKRTDYDKKIEIHKKDDKASKSNYDKEKLLAEMKAIDDNDNIEYYEEKVRRNSGSNIRSQITENLYRGIPTQRRGDIVTSSLTNIKINTKSKSNGLAKFH